MLSHDQLPVEILFEIFQFLDIPDILRLRRVSRYLNKVTRSKDAWTDVHNKAKYVRPPGPFPSQSARDLENALVPSYRIDRNLRYGGGAPRKLGEIWYTSVALGIHLVFSRLLLIAFKEEVRCHDLSLDAFDSALGASIIYRPICGILKEFHCVSAFDVGGRPFACLVLKEDTLTENTVEISIYSLNVSEQSGVTLDFLHKFKDSEFNILSVDLGPRVILVQGSTVLSEDSCIVALDVHTRTLFLLRSFWDALPETNGVSKWKCISTSTHILLARSARWTTFLRAFSLPFPNAYAGSIALSCSYHGAIRNTVSDGLVLLHDAVIDPSTQDTLIKVRVTGVVPSFCGIPVSQYGILRLDSSRREKTDTITFQPLGLLGKYSQNFDHPSFHGMGRTFHLQTTRTSAFIKVFEYNVRSGNDEPTDKAREYLSVLDLSRPYTLSDYDPYRGRICLDYSVLDHNVIEILDFAA